MPSRQAGGHSQRLLIGSVLVSVLSTTLLPMSARAQIIPDSAAPTNRQPIVTTASNGVPLVNIQTPSAGGVSRNAFSQFDVSGRGAIVNNANQSVQTMLGGWVQANPLLALPATVIVNEVNSSHPSLLRGYLEIAGQAAKLVIANPSGISCDGCGFINASRATLTTGVPQYSANGNLDSYLVRGGTVQFDGDGLDAQGADFTDVIARAVQVNAALRARQLNVIAGSNVVDASDLHTTTLADSNGKPQVAIDVSTLGGMYANKIWLVATEAGVGVRQAGTLGGGADDIRITSAGSLEVTGIIDSTRQLDINVAGRLINYGTINSDDSVSLNSATEIEHRGLIHGGEVLLQSPTIKNLGSGRIYGEHIAIAANSLISDIDASASATTSTTTTNSRGDPEPISFTPVIAARSRLDIGAEQITNREGALLYSEGDMSIGGRLDAQRHATGQARRLDNLSAQIEAGGNMSLAVDDIRNVNTHYRTRKQTKPLESIVEFAGSGSPNRYREGTHDVYTYIDESTHLHTPEGNYESWLLYRYQRSVSEDVTDESIPAQVTAGGNLHVRGQILTNDKSRILAGKDLDVQVTTLNNIDATGTRTVIDQGTVKAFWRHHKKGSDSTRAAEENYEPPAKVQTISLGVVDYQDQTSTDPTRIPNTADINHGADNVSRYIKLAAALPASSLYRSAPEASGYLVETDPRFTNRKQWLSSDYLLQQLALDPQQMQKRLGDGFYEQRLVREQIAQLTGRRFLTGYADDESQFQALMNNASTYAQAHQLRPGVALSAEQMAALTSDVVWLVEQDITLPSGQTTRALVPQVYVRTRDGDLNTEGALLGGDQINISLTGDLKNGGTIAGRQIVNLNAENVNNLSGAIAADSINVHSAQDINVIGGSINADSALVINAGNDIHLASTTASTITAQGSRSARDRVAGLYVSRNDGQMIVTAGHDLSIKAATIQQGQAVTDRMINMARADSIPESNAKAPSIQSDSPSAKSSTKSSTVSAAASNMINPTGRIMLAAGNDVQLDTVTETRSESVNWGGGNYRSESRRSETAATIDTAGSVDIVAGRDIISRGAHITARDGDINAMARRDVTLSTSESAVSLDEAHRHTLRGFLSSATISTRDTLEQTTQLGTLLSGNDVNIQSGQDIHIKGSNIVSSHTTSIDAGRKVSIAAATDTRTESHQYQKQSSGIMGSGGFGVTIGTRSLSTTSNVTATTASAANVGSTEGKVGISAGDSVAQTGSDLIAPQGDVTIAARKVDITAARNTETIITDTQFKQSGLTVAISNPIVNAVQTAQAMTAAASNTKDSRMKALAAANTAMAAKAATDAVLAGQGSSINGKPDQIGTGNDAAGNATSRDANTVDKLGGVQLAISVGTIKNNSHGVVNQTEVVASTIAAGGDVSIIAASGQALSSSGQSDPKQHEIIQSNIKQSNRSQSNTPQSDITIRGSQINAGHQLTLLAEHALDLQAASNTQTQAGTNLQLK
jgi:filamentous hemagglutinin